MFGVKLKYRFGPGGEAETETAAAYAPPPAQAPSPAPRVTHNYMVFFDFNRSDLTPQALAIVDQAANNATPAKATEITVTGHTDTVGSEAYNMRLSRRRAESVAAELEKEGITSSEIEIVAKGKHDLLVPTGDGDRDERGQNSSCFGCDRSAGCWLSASVRGNQPGSASPRPVKPGHA
jgi:OOP family OmpA-OmpF porin